MFARTTQDYRDDLLRRLMTIGSALAIAVGAAIALSMPVDLASRNHVGEPIACGEALRAESAPAKAADDRNRDLHNGHPDRFAATDYEAQCAGLIAAKRRHAIVVSTAAATVMLTIGGLNLLIRRAHSRGSTTDQRSIRADKPLS